MGGGGSAPEAKQPIAGKIVKDLYQKGPLKQSLYDVLNPVRDDAYSQAARERLVQSTRAGFGARGLAGSGIAQRAEQEAVGNLELEQQQLKYGQAVGILGTASGGPTAIPGQQPRGLFGLK